MRAGNEPLIHCGNGDVLLKPFFEAFNKARLKLISDSISPPGQSFHPHLPPLGYKPDGNKA